MRTIKLFLHALGVLCFCYIRVEADEVLCDGMPAYNYCDCSGDCGSNLCACAEALSCCESESYPYESFLDGFASYNEKWQTYTISSYTINDPISMIGSQLDAFSWTAWANADSFTSFFFDDTYTIDGIDSFSSQLMAFLSQYSVPSSMNPFTWTSSLLYLQVKTDYTFDKYFSQLGWALDTAQSFLSSDGYEDFLPSPYYSWVLSSPWVFSSSPSKFDYLLTYITQNYVSSWTIPSSQLGMTLTTLLPTPYYSWVFSSPSVFVSSPSKFDYLLTHITQNYFSSFTIPSSQLAMTLTTLLPTPYYTWVFSSPSVFVSSPSKFDYLLTYITQNYFSSFTIPSSQLAMTLTTLLPSGVSTYVGSLSATPTLNSLNSFLGEMSLPTIQPAWWSWYLNPSSFSFPTTLPTSINGVAVPTAVPPILTTVPDMFQDQPILGLAASVQGIGTELIASGLLTEALSSIQTFAEEVAEEVAEKSSDSTDNSGVDSTDNSDVVAAEATSAMPIVLIVVAFAVVGVVAIVILKLAKKTAVKTGIAEMA